MPSLRRGETALDRRLRAEMRAERRSRLDRRRGGSLRRRLGWLLAAIGALAFVASYLGALSGVTVLPFDDHHVIGQFGGGALAVLGVVAATSLPHDDR